tara:strand:+ start:38 stop:637 length:600 start_codon:yes stop_codon:yes gene_type:complete
MKGIFNESIGIFENAFSNEWCDKIIDIFETHKNKQYTRLDINPNELSFIKEDTSLNFSSIVPEVFKSFNQDFFSRVYPTYSSKYSILKHFEFHSIIKAKIQKTLPTQGYHTWHCETQYLEYAHRLMAFTVYLNDVKEGGETEFLYQSLRVSPKKGTVVIWPAGYTHAHRGNPPLSGEKYIITGWIEFIPETIKQQNNNE